MKTFGIATLCYVVTTSIAWAGASWPGACGPDISKFCPGTGGPLATYHCLNEQGTAVSYDCRANLRELQTILSTTESRCQQDVTKFCETVPMGGGGRIRCLRAATGKLTEPCTQALAALSGSGL